MSDIQARRTTCALHFYTWDVERALKRYLYHVSVLGSNLSWTWGCDVFMYTLYLMPFTSAFCEVIPPHSRSPDPFSRAGLFQRTLWLLTFLGQYWQIYGSPKHELSRLWPKFAVFPARKPSCHYQLDRGSHLLVGSESTKTSSGLCKFFGILCENWDNIPREK